MRSMDRAPCPFCSPEKNEIVFGNMVWYARWNAFPATRGHLLIIPFRHVTGYFETSSEEKAALSEMLEKGKKFLIVHSLHQATILSSIMELQPTRPSCTVIFT